MCKEGHIDKANISDRDFGAPAESAGIRALAIREERCLYTAKKGNEKTLKHMGCTGIPHL